MENMESTIEALAEMALNSSTPENRGVVYGLLAVAKAIQCQTTVIESHQDWERSTFEPE